MTQVIHFVDAWVINIHMTEQEKTAVLEIYDSGRETRASHIAKELNLTAPQVYKFLVKNGRKMQKGKPLPSKDDFERAVQDSFGMKNTMEKLGYTGNTGGTIRTFRRCVKKYGTNISHFPPIRERLSLATRVGILKSRKSDSEVFTYKEESMRKHQTEVRNRFREIVPDCQCEQCNITNMWNGKILTLQLDHINGNPSDNRLENLRWLCPNCHSQQETTYIPKSNSYIKTSDLVNLYNTGMTYKEISKKYYNKISYSAIAARIRTYLKKHGGKKPEYHTHNSEAKTIDSKKNIT